MLDDATWSTVDDAFDRALALDGAAREAFLASLDARTRAALAPLLASALADDPLLDHPEAALACLHDGDAPDSAAPGARVGPYSLDALVGEGGMGRVFRAHRADGAFEQTVAVKVVRASLALAGADVAARLRRERALLATLDHPGIARLVDGGETDDGVPYLVTEFVDGAPITEWADAHALGVEARVRLVVDVARAVDHAHRRLVVHRDLKPSNVLVAEHDGAARPVVLDFGIAKLLETAETPTAGAFPLTRTGMRLLTPAYAAPELYEPTATVTTAADVYGLGALLYEMLTARRPHDDAPATGRAPTTEPARPSKAVTTLAGGAPSAVGVASRSRSLRGDLDTICLKALHPDPARRYATAAALADDLERHLAGRPVEARPDSLAYVAGRFVRRNRATAAAAAVALAALVGGLSVALVSLTAERAARAEAEASAKRATMEAEQADEAARLLGSLFQAADPSRGDRPVTAREALDAGIGRVADVESDALRGYLLGVLGGTYIRIGEVATADSLLAEALRTLDATPSTEPAERAMLRVSRASTRAALDDPEGALALSRRAYAEVRSLGDDPRTHRALRGLARALLDAGRHADAHAPAEAAVAMARRLGDEEALIWSLLTHAQVFGVAEGDPRALALLDEAERHSRRRHGVGSAETLEVQVTRGWVLGLVGRHEESEALLRRVLVAHGRRFGTQTLAAGYMHSYVGDAQRRLGRDREARDELRAALAVSLPFLPPDHADLGTWRTSLATALNRTGEHAAAETEAREALRIAEAHASSPGDLAAALARAQVALALHGQGRSADARPAVRRALAALDAVAPRLPVDAADVAAARAALRATRG